MDKQAALLGVNVNHFKASSLTRLSAMFACLLALSIVLAGCITIEVPSESEPAPQPRAPDAVRRMENLGYRFQYHPDPDPYWEAQDFAADWSFRVWDDGSFGMSGQFGPTFGAQTEASIDFFKSLGVSPDQARLTVELTTRAMASADGEASACDRGLCCNAQVVMSQQLYLWFCER